MAERHSLSLARYQQMRAEAGGMCTSCGTETDGVEPDARRYVCDHCGARSVYGCEELLLMGRVK